MAVHTGHEGYDLSIRLAVRREPTIVQICTALPEYPRILKIKCEMDSFDLVWLVGCGRDG